MTADFQNRHRRLARGEWHDAARLLRRQNPGWTNRQIGEALGVTASAVSKALRPARDRSRERESSNRWKGQNRDRARAYNREYLEVSCPECGGPMQRGHETCRACWMAAAEVRRMLAEGMWADGWTCREIGEVFGWSKEHMGVRIAQWRKNGHANAFPHRYSPERVRNISEGWARTRVAA